MHDYTLFVAIATDQVDRVMQFYQQLCASEPSTWLEAKYAEFQLNGLKLAIFRPKEHHLAEFTAPTSGALSLCLEVPNLDAAIAQLAALSDRAIDPIIEAAHGRECYTTDPAGTRLILYEPR